MYLVIFINNYIDVRIIILAKNIKSEMQWLTEMDLLHTYMTSGVCLHLLAIVASSVQVDTFYDIIPYRSNLSCMNMWF